MEGEVADIVGLGCSPGVGFKEGIDDFLCGLEGTGGVKGEVAPIIESGCFFNEYRLLWYGILWCMVYGVFMNGVQLLYHRLM